MWDILWTRWHWDRFFSEFFGFLVSISFHRESLYSYIVWEMNSRPLMATVQRHGLTPIGMNNCQFNKSMNSRPSDVTQQHNDFNFSFWIKYLTTNGCTDMERALLLRTEAWTAIRIALFWGPPVSVLSWWSSAHVSSPPVTCHTTHTRTPRCAPLHSGIMMEETNLRHDIISPVSIGMIGVGAQGDPFTATILCVPISFIPPVVPTYEKIHLT
jgi:hypothetical protein